MTGFIGLLAPVLAVAGLHSAPTAVAPNCTAVEDQTFCSFGERGHSGPVLPYQCDSYDYYCNESYDGWNLF